MQPDKAFILFITGTSAVGKTTLYESLRADTSLSTVAFHDIDENGVPEIGRGPWRVYRVEELLYEAVKRQTSGQTTIICGITKPSEVLESPYFEQKARINFMLVEASMELIRERFAARVSEKTQKRCLR
ncbi:hypothetical protein HJC99_03820 [Candidatus Saccharibacteria bacterium]|nr:hypothetical protein [Candidatus Saccharibacteria bacterium]